MTENHSIPPLRRRWAGFAFICVSLLTISLNTTVLNVSMPVIARALDASTADLQWLVDAYILVFSALLLAMGSLSDRFGRKRFLVSGVVVFAACSLLAAASKTTVLVVVARALQGVGGAIIMPSTLSLIVAMFPEPRLRTKAIAIWGAMFGIGVGIGPIIGGSLLAVPGFPWRGVFLVNLPLAVIAVIGILALVPESYGGRSAKIDIPGVLLSIVGLFALSYSIIESGAAGWGNARVLISMLGAVVMLGAFILWEQRSPNAMLPLYLFRNPSFSMASIAMTICIFGLAGLSFSIPLFLQGVQGYTPLGTGLVLFPQAVVSVLVSWNSHHIINRFGVRSTVLVGFISSALALLLMGLFLQSDTSYAFILLGLILFYAGIDSALPAATVSIMGAVPESKAGVGSGMNEMAIHVGGALGVAVLGSIVNRTYLREVAGLSAFLPAETMEAVHRSIFSAQEVLLGMGSAAQEALVVVETAFTTGLRTALLFNFGIYLVLLLIVIPFLPREVTRSPEPDEMIADLV
jgi:EmrB/QacA subfamily drug resistance transporter